MRSTYHISSGPEVTIALHLTRLTACSTRLRCGLVVAVLVRRVGTRCALLLGCLCDLLSDQRIILEARSAGGDCERPCRFQDLIIVRSRFLGVGLSRQRRTHDLHGRLSLAGENPSLAIAAVAGLGGVVQ